MSQSSFTMNPSLEDSKNMRIIEAQVRKITPFLCAPSPDEEPSGEYTGEWIGDTSMKVCNFLSKRHNST